LEQKAKVKKKIVTTPIEDLKTFVVKCMLDKKGKDVVSLNLINIPEAVVDYFVVCHADSTTQVRAIVDFIESEAIAEFGIRKIKIEGRSNGEWALVDMGDIVAHVFQTEKREFYQLEDLWYDAIITKHLD
jgi:ribosome-associated protein